MKALPYLTVLFIGLKLTGYITWSWVWVLAPTWIPFGLAAILIMVIIVNPRIRTEFVEYLTRNNRDSALMSLYRKW
jgi:hypothetical protein